MKTTFQIANRSFTDYLKVTVNGETKYICEQETFEYTECEKLDVHVQFVDSWEYTKIRVKNPILRLLIAIVSCLFSVLNYFLDNNEGIGIDKAYPSITPFTVEKRFTLLPTDDAVITLKWIAPKYNKIQKQYTAPDILVKAASASEEVTKTNYSHAMMKREWKMYHIPSFSVLMIIVLLLNLLGVYMLVKAANEIPLSAISDHIVAVIAMAFCELVLLGLLVAVIAVIIRAYKLYREVQSRCRGENCE